MSSESSSLQAKRLSEMKGASTVKETSSVTVSQSAMVSEFDLALAPYDYDLPEEQIAVHPLVNRSDSKLLVLAQNQNKGTDTLEDSRITDIVSFFEAGDVLVLNNTKVLHARVLARRQTGGKVEVFFLHEQPDAEGFYTALIKPSRRLKEQEVLSVESDDSLQITLHKRLTGGEWLCTTSILAADLMEQVGDVPIPPYLRRGSDDTDSERYQTVFAKEKGAVAAPTAGLHFTPEILKTLAQNGVQVKTITLHVGIGTFRNLREEDLENNKLHAEWYAVSLDTAEAIYNAKRQRKRVVACGTTVTRCLETAFKGVDVTDNLLKLQDKFPLSGYTDIFIREGYTFVVVDGLLTNFHLPKSSLLMLVSAFAGRERVLAAYQYAIQNQYRFFSYGDAMLILPTIH